MLAITPFKLAVGTLGGAVLLKASAFAAAAAMLALASPAAAGNSDHARASAPEYDWLAVAGLRSEVQAPGSKEQKARLRIPCCDICTIGLDGTRLELLADATNGVSVGWL